MHNILSPTVFMTPDLEDIWHLVNDLYEVIKQTLRAHDYKGVIFIASRWVTARYLREHLAIF